MNNYPSGSPKSGESTWLWLFKIISGLLLVVILLIHLIVNHYTAPGGLMTFDDVTNYFHNPLVIVMEALFLVFVVIHSMLGLRAIILDLHPSRKAMIIWNSLLTITGFTAIVYGIWLLTTIINQG